MCKHSLTVRIKPRRLPQATAQALFSEPCQTRLGQSVCSPTADNISSVADYPGWLIVLPWLGVTFFEISLSIVNKSNLKSIFKLLLCYKWQPEKYLIVRKTSADVTLRGFFCRIDIIPTLKWGKISSERRQLTLFSWLSCVIPGLVKLKDGCVIPFFLQNLNSWLW